MDTSQTAWMWYRFSLRRAMRWRKIQPSLWSSSPCWSKHKWHPLLRLHLRLCSLELIHRCEGQCIYVSSTCYGLGWPQRLREMPPKLTEFGLSCEFLVDGLIKLIMRFLLIRPVIYTAWFTYFPTFESAPLEYSIHGVSGRSWLMLILQVCPYEYQ